MQRINLSFIRKQFGNDDGAGKRQGRPEQVFSD